MLKLDQASKEAWQWVENTEPNDIKLDHIHTAYRLKVQPCKPGKCKKNCRANPQCLNGLGEKVWLEALQVAEEEPEDPCNVKRSEGNFVGLTNLGATCYINSLLQLWFNNLSFRKAIYSWVPWCDPSEKENGTLKTLSEGGYIPSSPVGNLQLLFALMQFSKRSCVNPTCFISSLGIDTTTQQDAQEFSKLFVGLLEDRLQHQSDSSVSTMVQKQFRGQYEYVTKCSKCNNESASASPFYELDLSLGSKSDVTVEELLKEFLQEEKLEGSDQYFCSYCSSKQNATRYIRLRQLPPVLNVQLLRFVFDRKTGHKKKVTSVVHFPELLDMSAYVQNSAVPPSHLAYDLVAVLIHRGPSAYSGHYIAHIKDPISGAWYKFNDEVVTKLEGTKLKLGIEEEEEDQKKGKQSSKTGKGSHSSCNAYMLVYNRKETVISEDTKRQVLAEEAAVLPAWVQRSLNTENDNFEAWNRNIVNRKNENIQKQKDKHSNMRRVYQSLPCKSFEEGEFIATQWLTSWLSGSDDVKPVDNSAILCEHSKLNPDKFREFKVVSSSAASELYAEFKGGPRLDFHALCWDCVTSRCIASRLKTRIEADNKLVTNLMKGKLEPGAPAYWIGKDSLRCWKRMVLEKHSIKERESKMKKEPENGTGSSESDLSDRKTEVENPNGVTNGRHTPEEKDANTSKSDDHNTSMWQAEFEKSLTEERPTSSASGDYGFNDEILCHHGNLNADEGTRKAIPAAVWKIFHSYFPDAVEFTTNHAPCQQCMSVANEEERTKELYKQMAVDQRNTLQDLFRQKNRPNLSKDLPSEVFIIAREVLDRWRAFVRDPVRKEPVTSVANAELLCDHGGLLHRPYHDADTESKFAYLWPLEWETLGKYVHVDSTIMLRRSVQEGGAVSLETEPAVCQGCLADRLEEERRSQLVYTRATIYVRQVDKRESESQMDASEDPDFQMVSESKRPRLDSGQLVSLSPPPSSSAASSPSALASRRSQRMRRGRGEKEITVSSDQTLLDLKREIMKKFQVAPFDQHLTCNGRDLNDNQATLASLRIYPGTVIILKADEPSEDPSLMEDYARTAVPEEGFKGTELLRS